MSRGLGQGQLGILSLLLKAGGVLAVPALLVGLFGKARPGTKEYNVNHSTLSRSLGALRGRHLIQTYQGVAVAGRGVLVAALTGEGARRAGEIVWEEGT